VWDLLAQSCQVELVLYVLFIHLTEKFVAS
jgi:hypothetical protein